MNITDLSDEDILTAAEPMWTELVRASNDGEYGKFIRNFDYSLTQGLNEIEVGKQFANSELTRNLSEVYDYLGIIRRGEHVTVLYRVRSTKRDGEWLGRLVLGINQDDEIKIFGASVF